MPSFIDVVNGANADASTIQQVVDALKGTAGKGVPLSPTAVNDAINFALAVKNNDAGASKAAVFYKADGSVLLQVDKNGVVASPDGVAAAAKVVTGNDTGTVTNAMLAGSIANAKLAADVARANQLTNGGFELWQRGTGPFTAFGAYCADRWGVYPIGTDTLSVTQTSTGGGVTDLGSNNAANAVFVLGNGAGGTYIYQNLKTTDGQGYQYRGKTVSLSMRVRCGSANAVRVTIIPNGTGAATVNSVFHSGGSTYETLTISAPIPSDATSVIVGINFVASCTAQLDNASLVLGSVAADYVPLPPADDLARCLRYYETTGTSTYFPGTAGYGAAGQSNYIPIWFAAKKPVAPTCTVNGTFSPLTNCSAPFLSVPSVAGVAFGVTTTALGAFNIGSNSSGAIVAEANP